MSSRSLAAARARRAGENAPPVSGNRPGTSIGSSAAFSQQMLDLLEHNNNLILSRNNLINHRKLINKSSNRNNKVKMAFHLLN